MQVKASQAVSMITSYIKARLVPMLVGSPGCGKSQIVYKIAQEYGLKVIDLRLSQCDPCDLAGFPTIEGQKADYVPMKHFPIVGDPIPDGYAGWLLFLDEANSAPPAIQAAAYKLILDRQVGSHMLHKNVAIVCAGNLETDGAIVHPMSTALQSRVVHMELIVDHIEWCDWAAKAQVDHRISDFIKFKPGSLFTFTPDHTDRTYACPRTWEFADRIIKSTEEDSKDRLPMLAGTLSEGVAREFIGFCNIYKTLPKIGEIVEQPERVRVPPEPSVLLALTGSLSHNASQDNFGQLMKFINRLPVEFQVVALKETQRRHDRWIRSHPAFIKWITGPGRDIF